MRIRTLVRRAEGAVEHAAGDIIDLSEELAHPLIDAGHAEEVDPSTPLTMQPPEESAAEQAE